MADQRARNFVEGPAGARRSRQLQREAEVCLAELAPDGWLRVRSRHHPKTIQVLHYRSVLALIPQLEHAIAAKQYAVAWALYETATRHAETARAARREEETGDVYERAASAALRRARSGRRRILTPETYQQLLTDKPQLAKFSATRRDKYVADWFTAKGFKVSPRTVRRLRLSLPHEVHARKQGQN